MVKRTLGIYLAKHPLALAIPGDIWALQLNSVKMTDSTLGFGKKLLWEREAEKQTVNDIINNLNLN
ncbi:MAG: hypothetical protein IPI54_11635 [Chitinophagaceae bacterium]|nr:hypothetical protein [Chitinophagaceae bacterium]